MAWIKHSQEQGQKKIDPVKDIKTIKEYLKEVKTDLVPLIDLLNQLEELEKESSVHKESIYHVNLETQAEVIEKVLERYQFFQDDVDINGLRVKEIANEFLVRAQKAGLKDLVKEKKNNPHWKLRW